MIPMLQVQHLYWLNKLLTTNTYPGVAGSFAVFLNVEQGHGDMVKLLHWCVGIKHTRSSG